MLIFYGDKTTVVQFVADIVLTLKPASVSTMIISRGRSEELYALFAIDTSLEDIVVTRASHYSWLPLSISTGNILVGKYQPR